MPLSQIPQFGGTPTFSPFVPNQFGGFQGLIRPQFDEDILQQFLAQRQGLIDPFLQQFPSGQPGAGGFGFSRPDLPDFASPFGGGQFNRLGRGDRQFGSLPQAGAQPRSQQQRTGRLRGLIDPLFTSTQR